MSSVNLIRDIVFGPHRALHDVEIPSHVNNQKRGYFSPYFTTESIYAVGRILPRRHILQLKRGKPIITILIFDLYDVDF